MCNDVELFINLINMTDVMKELLLNDIYSFIECQKLLDYTIIKNIEEIKDTDNKKIKEALNELLNNDRFLKIIQEETKIDVNSLK